ncbi:putative MalT-like TPR region domain-containing protein [Seiridium unicorne]|uniref:MalT-like TPR region domain-containing protein n=1 Tax=Seiridium unicorne TaxID=138068 RepID=A0ABR2VD79_9PEZI
MQASTILDRILQKVKTSLCSSLLEISQLTLISPENSAYLTHTNCRYPKWCLHTIHGFMSSGFSVYQNRLEHWVTKAVQQAEQAGQLIHARVFRFDMSTVLLGSSELLAASQRLRQYLMNTYPPIQPEAGGSDDSYSSNSPSDARGRHIVFMAHGLGCWVVKGALARADSRSFAFNPMFCLFIDSLGAEESFSHYITSIIKRFLIPMPSQSGTTDSLELSITDIDGNFQRYKVYCQQKRHPGRKQNGYQFPDQAVRQNDITGWLRDDPVVMPGRRAWWTSWFRGHQNTAAYTTGEISLFDSLKEMTLLASPLEPHLKESSDDESALSDSETTSLTANHQTSGSSSTETSNWKSRYPMAGDDYVVPGARSVFSTSTVDIVRTQLGRPKGYDLAYSCFQRSDFRTAQILFSRCYEDMIAANAPSQTKIRLRIRIMSVKIYRGKYSQAKKDLREIKALIKQATSTEKTTDQKMKRTLQDYHRWKATYFLHSGQWNRAAKKLSKLLNSNSDEQGPDFRASLARDLALSYAHLGRHDWAREKMEMAFTELDTSSVPRARGTPQGSTAEVSKPNEEMPQEGVKEEGKSNLKEEVFHIASAQISFQEGDFVKGLDTCSHALEAMERILGKRHIKSLTAAYVKAWCLAGSGRYSDAEALCSKTIKVTGEQQGRKHPLCIEATELLVYIFRYQNRFAEAIGTGKALCALAHKQLPQNHPQTLRSEYQLAAAHMDNGNFATAEQLLLQVIERAESFYSSLGFIHPDILRYKSRLALAHLSVGKVEQARTLILKTTSQQIKFYSATSSASSSSTQSDDGKLAKPEQESGKTLESVLSDIRRLEDSKDTVLLHPFLITTLCVLLKTEAQLQRSDSLESRKALSEELRGILENKWDQLSITQRVPTVALKYNLALALRETSHIGDNASESIRLLQEVLAEEGKTLGFEHLDTLCTERDLIIATFRRDVLALDKEEYFTLSLEEVYDRSAQVLISMESQFGEYHPQTLESKMWCLSVKTIIANSVSMNDRNDTIAQDEQATIDNEITDSDNIAVDYVQEILQEADEIVRRARSPLVREERVLKSFELEKNIGRLLLDFGLYTEAKELLSEIRSTIQGAIDKEVDKVLLCALEELRGSLLEVMDEIELL